MERTLNRAEADGLNAASANEEQLGARKIHRAVGSATDCGGEGWGNWPILFFSVKREQLHALCTKSCVRCSD